MYQINPANLLKVKKNVQPSISFNSIDYTLESTDRKKQQIINLCNSYKIDKDYKIINFAKLIGNLNVACPAVAYGLIQCKRLERQKFLGDC